MGRYHHHHFSPFISDIENFRDQMYEAFSPMMKVAEEVQPATQTWNLPGEMIEADEEYILRLWMPGVEADKVEVEATSRSVTVGYVIEPEELEEDQKVLFREFRYGKRQRTIQFGQVIRGEEISANYRDGILTLKVPKENGERKKTIKVNVNPT